MELRNPGQPTNPLLPRCQNGLILQNPEDLLLLLPQRHAGALLNLVGERQTRHNIKEAPRLGRTKSHPALRNDPKWLEGQKLLKGKICPDTARAKAGANRNVVQENVNDLKQGKRRSKSDDKKRGQELRSRTQEKSKQATGGQNALTGRSSGTTKVTADLNSRQDCTGEGKHPCPKMPGAKTRNYLLKIGTQKKSRRLLQILNCSTRDCHMCTNKCSYPEVIKKHLCTKYLATRDVYDAKVINDLIFNENTHIVSVFKDYLIYDDTGEFLKRYYAKRESVPRLGKVYEFYYKCSQVFPNYVLLEEKKFMFKNIERKQRNIDQQQREAANLLKKNMPTQPSAVNSRLFSSTFVRDVSREAHKAAEQFPSQDRHRVWPSDSLENHRTAKMRQAPAAVQMWPSLSPDLQGKAKTKAKAKAGHDIGSEEELNKQTEGEAQPLLLLESKRAEQVVATDKTISSAEPKERVWEHDKDGSRALMKDHTPTDLQDKGRDWAEREVDGHADKINPQSVADAYKQYKSDGKGARESKFKLTSYTKQSRTVDKNLGQLVDEFFAHDTQSLIDCAEGIPSVALQTPQNAQHKPNTNPSTNAVHNRVQSEGRREPHQQPKGKAHIAGELKGTASVNKQPAEPSTRPKKIVTTPTVKVASRNVGLLQTASLNAPILTPNKLVGTATQTLRKSNPKSAAKAMAQAHQPILQVSGDTIKQVSPYAAGVLPQSQKGRPKSRQHPPSSSRATPGLDGKSTHEQLKLLPYTQTLGIDLAPLHSQPKNYQGVELRSVRAISRNVAKHIAFTHDVLDTKAIVRGQGKPKLWIGQELDGNILSRLPAHVSTEEKASATHGTLSQAKKPKSCFKSNFLNALQKKQELQPSAAEVVLQAQASILAKSLKTTKRNRGTGLAPSKSGGALEQVQHKSGGQSRGKSRNIPAIVYNSNVIPKPQP